MNEKKYKKERIKYIKDEITPYTVAGCDDDLAEGIFNLFEKENYEIQHEYNKRYSDLMYKYREMENSYKWQKIKNNNLQNRIDKAIDKLEFYNGWESNLYAPVQEVIDILKGDDEN